MWDENYPSSGFDVKTKTKDLQASQPGKGNEKWATDSNGSFVKFLVVTVWSSAPNRRVMERCLSPEDLYRERLKGREQRIVELEKTLERLGSLRVALFIVAIAIIWWLLNETVLSAWWLLIPLVAFFAAVFQHSQVKRRKALAERAADFYRAGLARLNDRWEGTGQTGERFDDPHHVYAADLDLFGRGGLFELLFTGRTRMGEECLARWLLAPAVVATLQERQAALSELRTRTDLREDLAVVGADAGVGVQPEALVKWAEAPNRLTQPWLGAASYGLPLLAVAGIVAWNQWGLISPFIAVLLVEFGVLRLLRNELQQTLHDTEQAFEDLKLLSGLLERIEREEFVTPRMLALKHSLASHEVRASRTMARLATVVQWIESRRNPLLQFLSLPLLYSVHVARAAERWRKEHGTIVRAWLDAIGEIEALLSFATYSFEHPNDPFPTFVEGDSMLRGQQLGHPLIPKARCVRNDVSIAPPTRVLLISGSNMSGKSTLLRTIGINTVLAMAGAPVRAKSFVLTPLHVGASIRINDSLHDGSSRFYAEITRLRQLLDLTERTPPLLFLLDELMQGTNSKDRRIGAEGVLRGFLERNAIGLISTHDLALTDIDTAGSPRLRNMHFQDELIEGQMHFDFTLREGVVTKSNGVELMRSIGLEV
jgi:MutS domain V